MSQDQSQLVKHTTLYILCTYTRTYFII